jgi:hypothetical protein
MNQGAYYNDWLTALAASSYLKPVPVADDFTKAMGAQGGFAAK